MLFDKNSSVSSSDAIVIHLLSLFLMSDSGLNQTITHLKDYFRDDCAIVRIGREIVCRFDRSITLIKEDLSDFDLCNGVLYSYINLLRLEVKHFSFFPRASWVVHLEIDIAWLESASAFAHYWSYIHFLSFIIMNLIKFHHIK